MNDRYKLSKILVVKTFLKNKIKFYNNHELVRLLFTGDSTSGV